jgi:hypothetical protein
MGVVIFAGSFHGKTTAHNKQLAFDVEAEPPEAAINYDKWLEEYETYRKIEEEWKSTRVPKNLERRNKAFNAMCIEAYQSDVPVLLSHHSGELEKMAKRAGREVRFVLLDYMEMARRLEATPPDKAPIFRMMSAYGFAQGLARRPAMIVLYPTIEKAIALWR